MVRVLSIAVLAVCLRSTMARVDPDTVVEIRLHRSLEATGHIVHIRDVADVLGGSRELRSRVNALDIEAFETRRSRTTIGPRDVRMRCLVAGIADGRFRISGARACRVQFGTASEPDRQDPESRVLDDLKQRLAVLWKVTPQQVSVRLTRPILELAALPPDTDVLSVRTYPPGEARPGHLSARALARVSSGRLLQFVVHADTTYRADGAGPAGLKSSRQLEPTNRAGRARLVARPQRNKNAARPIVVRPGDIVQLVAKKGSLRVSLANAEVRQAGRVGDGIRLRNPKSGKIVTGRVADSSTAIIEL